MTDPADVGHPEAPPRPSFRDTIRRLPNGNAYFFEGAKGDQIYPIVSRLRREFPERGFILRTQKGGVKVWRDDPL